MQRLEIVLGLLAAIAFLAALGRKLRIADPIVFALGGLVLALVPAVPDVRLSPQIVLLLFLPPLIYAASRNTSWAETRHNVRAILFLAVGLVLATMGVVAGVFHLLRPDLPWGVAFILGAIVGPPDAVAATAIAGSLRLPRRVVEVLEGEGLFNDVTALVAFQIALAAVVSGERFHLGEAAGTFLLSASAATLIGLGVGWLGHKAVRRLHNADSEVTLNILEPFVAYLLAEHFHASGVMAVLVLGLYVGNLRVQAITSAGRLLGGAIWEMAEFTLTGLSFVLVGLQLPQAVAGMAGESRALAVCAAVTLVVILVRPAWIYAFGRVARPAGDEAFSSGEVKVVSWAGMRGVISLALALSLPADLPGRGLVVLVTFVTIFATLVGQGMTLPPLIRRLGVQAAGGAAARMEIEAKRRLIHAALRRLDDLDGSDEATARVRRIFEARLEAAERRSRRDPEEDVEAETSRLLRELVGAQHEELQAMRRAGEVDTPTANRLQRRLDATERMRVGVRDCGVNILHGCIQIAKCEAFVVGGGAFAATWDSHEGSASDYTPTA